MKFSVLMSVYKNEKPEYFEQALASIVNQSLLPDEILCVEDGKLTPELETILEKYSHRFPSLFKVIKFSEHRGLGLALRDGVIACKFDYIARMDTDDIAKAYRFEQQIAYLEQHKDIALLGSWVREFSTSPDKPDSETKLPCSYKDIIDFSKKRNPFRHMTVILKKTAVLESGNYRDFLRVEDYDLWVRMLQKGFLAENLPEFLVDVRANRDMFERRGGFAYLQQEIKFQNFLYNSRWISFFEYFRNIIVRLFVRTMPNSMRVWFYKNFLRG